MLIGFFFRITNLVWLVKNLVRSCGNDGELGCSGGEAALCGHVVRRIALATVSIWSCNPIDRLFLLLCFFKNLKFLEQCVEKQLLKTYLFIYMFKMFKSFRVSLCWDKWVLQGSQETMCRSCSFTDRQMCWGFSLLSALWSGLFCDYQFDITTIREAAVCLCDISLESSLSLKLFWKPPTAVCEGQKKGFNGLSFRKERGAFAGCSLGGGDRSR